MAKLKMFSVLDQKLKLWSPPMFMKHVGQAERTWQDLVNEPESMLCKHPKDFSLYQVGEFDEETAESAPIVPPVLVMHAEEAKRKPQGELPFDLSKR